VKETNCYWNIHYSLFRCKGRLLDAKSTSLGKFPNCLL